MEDKDIRAMIKQIVPFAHKVILCEPKMDRAASTKIIAKKLQEWNVKYHQIKDVKEAVIYTLSIAHPKDLICITGSLFTVGEARRNFFNP
jgi:dihydrofolate synthase/folylpolyglutamate synthase